MYTVVGWCAGFVVLEEKVPKEALDVYMQHVEFRLMQGKYSFQFAMMRRIATELCVDVYEGSRSYENFRFNLSRAFKK